MAIFPGGMDLSGIQVGQTPVKEVWAGDQLVYQLQQWTFADDFNRSTIGSAWTGSGGVIENGALKKNTTAGTARYTINQTFSTDDLTVEVTIGTTADRVQSGTIIMGDPDGDFVALTFSKERFHAFGFDRGGWPSYGDFPTQPLDDGDKITLSRSGTWFTVSYNGNVVGTFSTGLARGPNFRKVAVEVKMAVNFFVRWYGPTLDAVKVREN